MFSSSRKGMALYLVLAVLMVVVIVASLFLNLVLNQSRLSHHQVSRTQAYFAARLGMNYAIEMLSHNDIDWSSPSEFNRTICRLPAGGCTKVESDLPGSINNVTVNVGAVNTTTGVRSLNVTVDYSYQL